MRPVSVTVGSQTSSVWIPTDYLTNPFNVSFGCVISAGATLTYKAQYTYDDVLDPDVTPVAFDHTSLTGKSANADGSITFPVRGVRLTVTAYTGGDVTLTLLQGVTN